MAKTVPFLAVLRYLDGGFDLGLTYITDRIIALGFPSEGKEAMYRNKMRDVQRFFKKRHSEAAHKNLWQRRHRAQGSSSTQQLEQADSTHRDMHGIQAAGQRRRHTGTLGIGHSHWFLLLVVSRRCRLPFVLLAEC